MDSYCQSVLNLHWVCDRCLVSCDTQEAQGFGSFSVTRWLSIQIHFSGALYSTIWASGSYEVSLAMLAVSPCEARLALHVSKPLDFSSSNVCA